MKESSRNPQQSIFDLDFADDIALLEGDLEKAKQQLKITANIAREVGLEVNIKKTEAFTNQEHPSDHIELDGQHIEWVTNFKYLGSMIASSETDIKTRKGLAWAAFWKLKNIFQSKTLSYNLKKKIFDTACLPVLLYGCESWILTQKLKESLESYTTNCYRIMLNISYKNKNKNYDIYQSWKLQSIVLIIQRRQLRYVGHCFRKEGQQLIKDYVLYTPNPRHGHKSVGRSPMLYQKYIFDIINSDVNPTMNSLRKLAMDRNGWKRNIVDACLPRLYAND